MLRKALILSLALMGVMQATNNAEAANCYEECNSSLQTCPWVCGGTPDACYADYLVCVRSCDNGVGPWLIC